MTKDLLLYRTYVLIKSSSQTIAVSVLMRWLPFRGNAIVDGNKGEGCYLG